MFLLRYRDPRRYGAWLDTYAVEQHPDGPALQLGQALDRVALDAAAEEAGEARPEHPPLDFPRIVEADELAELRERRRKAARRRREADAERSRDDEVSPQANGRRQSSAPGER
jgi:hypothetical protein